MNGKVKWFNRVKEFGFVTGEDGKDYFVHVSEIAPGARLDEGTEVTFEPAQGDKGIKATKVAIK